jgi:hypothetical protein
MFCFWVVRRTRQAYNYHVVDGTLGNPTTGFLSILTRNTRGSLATVVAKATFHCALFLCVQYLTSQNVVYIARIIASTFMTDNNMRRQCRRLLDRGLECSAALRYHDLLNIAAAATLLCIIRGFQLHVELPKRRAQHTNYSLGFLRLLSKCRDTAQTILAVPIAVVYMYTRIPRETPWNYAKLLLVQASASCAILQAILSV